MRPLTNIPIAVMGCHQDLVVSNYDIDNNILINDSSTALDVYATTGALYGEGTSYQVTATGALKNATISNLTFATGAAGDVLTGCNTIASDVRTMSATDYYRFSVDNQYLLTGYYTEFVRFGSHGSWAEFQFPNILRSIVTGETIPF